MKKLICMLVVCCMFTGCGYSAKDNELIGQVKKVRSETPLICPDYYTADISLGVMKNGVGSMSTQDIWLVIDKAQLDSFKKANENGDIVKVKYNEKRIAFCTPDSFATSIEVIK